MKTQRELPAIRETFVKVGDRAAAVLRRISGGSVGWRSTRRGSFLVLVIGTLALLAVISIIYATIGRQDARTQVAVAKRERLDDVPRKMADYINRIVSDDSLATWFDGREPLTGTIALIRDASDYPFTDPLVRSDTNDPLFAFHPSGGVNPLMLSRPATAWNRQIPPSDPWLADTRPTYLDFAGAGWSDPDRPYLDFTDWKKISNIAPDGRFVNLVNLRNNWGALPGTQANRMSSQMRVWAPTGNGAPGNTLDSGGGLNPNIPAHLDSRQVRAFRPINDPRLNLPPSNPGFIGNMWADTDGDGMADSRWFEMVDARDINSIRELLETDGRYRYFFATRIVDLSGKINVNTATDFLREPSAAAPAGITAGDVDLQRFLTMTDRYDEYQVGGNFGGYDGGELIDPENPDRANQASFYFGYDAPQAYRTGQFGYRALRMAQAKGATPPRAKPDDPNTLYAGTAGLNQFAIDSQITPDSWDFGPANSDGAYRRNDYYLRRALGDRGVLYDYSNSDYLVSGVFGIDDLAELLERRTFNAPGLVSNLEVTLGGRDDTNDTPPGTLRYSPLRDNRELAYERVRDANDDGVIDDENYLLLETSVRDMLTTISGARGLRNARGVDFDRLSVGELRADAAALLDLGVDGANTIFKAYALALMPFGNENGVWSVAATAPSPTHTLFYGYQGPELALYTSGFLAANFYASAQSGRNPQPFTLLIDEDFLETLQSEAGQQVDQQQYGAWHAGRRLDLNSIDLQGNRSPVNRLASNGDPVAARALNIYGVTPQPFITEIATFTAYTDAPTSAGGDNEADGTPITIDGDLNHANTDALYRVVAFKLTNPFNQEIVLSDEPFTDARFYNAANPSFPPVDHAGSFYYIQWGDNYFQLSALEEQTYVTNEEASSLRAAGLPAVGDDARFSQYIATGTNDDIITLEPIRIPAGKSVVCYAMSQVPRRILNDRILPADPLLQASPDATLRGNIIRAIEDQLDNDADIAGSYWVPQFNPLGAPTGSGDGRIDLPSTTEFRNLVPATQPSVYLWRAVRFGDEGLVDQNVSTPGGYWDNSPPIQPVAETFPRNFAGNDQLVDRLRIGGAANLDHKLAAGNQDIDGTDAADDDSGYSITLAAFVRRPSDPRPDGDPAAGIIPAYCIEPKGAVGWNNGGTEGSTTPDDSDFTTYSGAGRTMQSWRLAMYGSPINSDIARHPGAITGNVINPPPRRPIGTTFDDQYPEVYINGRGYEAPSPAGGNATVSTLRLADLLLPLGVGPMQNPLLPDSDPSDRERLRWTTLGEALAVAIGYQQRTDLDPADPLVVLTPVQQGSGDLFPFERGALSLNEFVPFEDVDTNREYNGPPATGNDVRRWLGIPLAMAILDNFTVSPGGVESLTRAVPGLININTTTVPVARTLPLISPPENISPIGQPLWWWPTGPLSVDADVAPAIIGYRDRANFDVRPQTAATLGQRTFESFRDQSQSGDPIDPFNPLTWTGRELGNRIVGINQQPGFRTVGEILAVKDRFFGPANFGDPINIDFLGFDGGNVDKVGVVSTVTSVDNGSGTPTNVSNDIDDEHSEQFILFNGIANSVTTRSDYFAAYFVVHGYQESDVTNLGPNDPMVPSIARRFMMIIDRSNVTERGQRGQVLLFKEVPYSY